jgi:hypothetical protein
MRLEGSNPASSRSGSIDARAWIPTGRSRALSGEAIQPEKPPYRPGGRTEGSRIACVRDLDGYRIELVERPR